MSSLRNLLSTLLFGSVVAACGGASGGGPSPTLPPGYAALPDTAVCIIDRTAPRGLTELPAKLDGEDVVVLSDGEVRPLADVHPVNVIAGYAGREAWLTRGDPIVYNESRFVRTGGERRVAIDLLVRLGEHQGILLFAGEADDPPPDALYVPTAPGCVFQAYAREDLIRR